MSTPFVAPETIHVPATSDVAPAAWGLVVNDDLNALNSRPRCVVASVAQSVANVTDTVLACSLETRDTDAMHSTVTNNSRITGQTAGDFEFSVTLRFAAANSGSYRIIKMRVNGGTAIEVMQIPHVADAAIPTIVTGQKSFTLAVGDYVEVLARQNSGGALNVTVEEFTARYIGA